MTRRLIDQKDLATLLKCYLKTERNLGGYLIEARQALPSTQGSVVKAVWYGFDAMETWLKENERRGTEL